MIMKPTELQIKVMEAALEHAKKVFKKTGRLDVEFFEDEGDAWEFYVNEFYSIEADTGGITFDKNSLNSKLPRGLEGCSVKVNSTEYQLLMETVKRRTLWFWPYNKFGDTEPKWAGYSPVYDSIFVIFKEDYTLESSMFNSQLYHLLSLNEILSIIEKYY